MPNLNQLGWPTVFEQLFGDEPMTTTIVLNQYDLVTGLYVKSITVVIDKPEVTVEELRTHIITNVQDVVGDVPLFAYTFVHERVSQIMVI